MSKPKSGGAVEFSAAKAATEAAERGLRRNVDSYRHGSGLVLIAGAAQPDPDWRQERRVFTLSGFDVAVSAT